MLCSICRNARRAGSAADSVSGVEAEDAQAMSTSADFVRLVRDTLTNGLLDKLADK